MLNGMPVRLYRPGCSAVLASSGRVSAQKFVTLYPPWCSDTEELHGVLVVFSQRPKISKPALFVGRIGENERPRTGETMIVKRRVRVKSFMIVVINGKW